MADIEKSGAQYDEYAQERIPSQDGSQEAFVTQYTEKEQRKIVWKIDRRLVTLTGLMYCASLIDRTNLGVANIAGMAKDLDLIGFRYSIITLVFFIPYVILQPPSTVLCRKIGPRIHLSNITVLWGAVMIGMGFAPNFKVMSGLRVILGALEAGFFPGCVYLLSTWYLRYEVGKRYSFFYILGAVASAFGGILAFGLSQMEGTDGIRGWRWIFIIEGALTIGLGIAGYFFFVGFPDDGKTYWYFLTREETRWIVDRVNADRSDAQLEPFTFGRFLRPALDFKIWGYALIFFDTTTVTYALAYFLPVILEDGMGFSTGAAQCLVAPPYVWGGIVMYATGWFGDKYHIRGPIIIFNMVMAIIGLALMGFTKGVGVRYFGVFLAAAGANSNVPATMAYQANNIRGQWKRAFCSASMVGFGGIGGIAGSLVFRSQDAPAYHPGLWACIACAILSIVVVCIETVFFRIANNKADRGELRVEGGEPSFRYTY
ncbi:MFS general substrate transporter [Rhizodiscina lignyota]|uniref:MFS general substrate transporter n=1 Tax=Rhizodiscina lignyota TaxID=1504668 RepID=A0A9P4M7S9_9PEZI|nr:MFS general substrate transporter [Rhizodiscina lignyota]